MKKVYALVVLLSGHAVYAGDAAVARTALLVATMHLVAQDKVVTSPVVVLHPTSSRNRNTVVQNIVSRGRGSAPYVIQPRPHGNHRTTRKSTVASRAAGLGKKS